MRKLTLTICILALTMPVIAQVETPRISQKASVSQTIGTTDIEIHYHRPGVKGRQIWGGLVPYGTPWRTGANEATTISFTDPVTIEGEELPAGTYSLFTVPGQESWTVVINEDPEQWGAYGYDPEKDALRFEVEPVPSDHTEWMRFTIDPTSPTSAVVNLEWEELSIPFDVAVDVEEIVWGDIDSSLASTYASAASWALESGERLEQGLEWANRSIEKTGEGVFNLWTKARLLHALGRSEEALPVMEKAIAMAEGNVPDDFMNILQRTMESIRQGAM
ncbi:MAG: DUF2911 domain-containing protein [Thermoanaerobaculia bacterium]|nr:DUF2911 domain-containing protein [Thermoanaerobaculia bacterium]